MTTCSHGPRICGGIGARDCQNTYKSRPRILSPAQATPLQMPGRGSRLSTSRYEFGVSCIIQGPPPRPGSCLHEGGRTAASEGAVLHTQIGHPKSAPRSRKPRPTPGCIIEQKASELIGEEARVDNVESMSRLLARSLL